MSFEVEGSLQEESKSFSCQSTEKLPFFDMDMTPAKYREREMEPGPFSFATTYFELINDIFLLSTDLLKDHCNLSLQDG